MKKQYETPTAEKIRFNYREQVVATSGDTTGSGEDPRTIFSDACNIQSMVVLGHDVCSNL